jgi:hypothetical protein
MAKDLPSADVIDKGGDLLINRLSFDALTGRFHNRRIIIRAGLEIYKMLGDNGQPLTTPSRRIVVVAQKLSEFDKY